MHKTGCVRRMLFESSVAQHAHLLQKGRALAPEAALR